MKTLTPCPGAASPLVIRRPRAWAPGLARVPLPIGVALLLEERQVGR